MQKSVHFFILCSLIREGGSWAHAIFEYLLPYHSTSRQGNFSLCVCQRKTHFYGADTIVVVSVSIE